MMRIIVLISLAFMVSCQPYNAEIRNVRRLDQGWVSILADTVAEKYNGFQNRDFGLIGWDSVTVPHNWDQYYGYRRLKHGNKHGSALYRRYFTISKIEKEKRYFLFFEGIGSYATIWVNGKKVGYHAGGRTTFTLDITDAIAEGDANLLAVRADEPAHINDLPWVCGGCSSEWGFSEGSQPLGIFRPVQLIETASVRVEPFGVHIWNDTTVTDKEAQIYVNTEVKNYSDGDFLIVIENRLLNNKGDLVAEIRKKVTIAAGQTLTSFASISPVKNPVLWHPDRPYLYTVQTRLYQSGKILDEVNDRYGIRWVKWDLKQLRGKQATNRFYVNGKPFFLNGTAEYEHLMGRSHSFTDEMVQSRVEQIRAAGFNLFRDAHQPHNLRYNKLWNQTGMLWWPQMSAHIWFDTPEFRDNFKACLRDFIKERRNSPSNILWGLQNESVLPESFARECTEIFREMDPTASTQRLVTTCNGGTGTDWNVVQNWSGTYGGQPEKYDEDLKRQAFNGEYGAWRSADWHAEGEFDQEGSYTEERMWQLMEMKLRLAESVSDSSCGHIQWLFASHENPGRTQSGEGFRALDRVGPVNYKGLFTVWGEPLDVYYMYRANYADGVKDPMVYIAGHSWPDRFVLPGTKSRISVFSNCEEVELFNDINGSSLGRLKNPGRGFHFEWDSVLVVYNLLHAVGYNNGKPVATDEVLLNHLHKAPGIAQLKSTHESLVIPQTNGHYIYRVNCGGDDYADEHGNTWLGDVQWQDSTSWGSLNWTDYFNDMPPFYGSQRQSYSPVTGTREWPLFQTYRYGMEGLRYRFPIPDGTYRVELFFMEPWYGVGGATSCKNWRLFDVVANGLTLVDDLDIWNEVGTNKALKKVAIVKVTGGCLEIGFNGVKASQAVISAIAVSSLDDKLVKAAPPAHNLIEDIVLLSGDQSPVSKKWLSTGDLVFVDSPSKFSYLPPDLYGAEWIQYPKQLENSVDKQKLSFTVSRNVCVYAAVNKAEIMPDEMFDWNSINDSIVITGQHNGVYQVYQKYFPAGANIQVPVFTTNSQFIIAVNAAHGMDDAIDLRPTNTYYARNGNMNGATARVVYYKNKDCVMVQREGHDRLSFVFSVGLASKYGLHFRYLNLSNDAIPVKMEIVSSDETIQWMGILDFSPSSEKWKSLRTDTGTTINAGIYEIRLTPLKEGEMYFDWVKVQ
ncbi:malectin domain-containing carbohydrate-binding protein [Geofilum sp. OHC36d9]|uniref:malectin domain-containing carbohydrate-binding protein n=1 Tax=Geofilum sp. OHC36d9 TaxID=3458413 RepID=UPI0040344961